MAYAIELSKESFKFSCTHFTIFSADRAERLHGHNYQARVRLEFSELDPNLGMAFDFNDVKPLIKAICDRLDEHVLVPALSPYLQCNEHGDQFEIAFAKRRYSLPRDDVQTLPLTNVTAEELARYVASELKASLERLPDLAPRLSSVSVTIEETRGQSVSYTMDSMPTVSRRAQVQ